MGTDGGRTDGPDPVGGCGHLACPLGFGVLGRHARTYGLQQTRPRPQTPDPRPQTPDPDPAVATIHLSQEILPQASQWEVMNINAIEYQIN